MEGGVGEKAEAMQDKQRDRPQISRCSGYREPTGDVIDFSSTAYQGISEEDEAPCYPARRAGICGDASRSLKPRYQIKVRGIREGSIR